MAKLAKINKDYKCFFENDERYHHFLDVTFEVEKSPLSNIYYVRGGYHFRENELEFIKNTE